MGSEMLTDYVNVCTTVFTPLEYGCCGYSEEEANEKYGEEDIEVFHQSFWPLEWTVSHRPENSCYCKLICLKSQKVGNWKKNDINSFLFNCLFLQEKVVG